MNKKPNFIFKWLAKKIQQVYKSDSILDISDRDMKYKNYSLGNAIKVQEPSVEGAKTTINIKLHIAAGGKIIETTVYNNHKDQDTQGLYIVTDDKVLGDEIEKIITMELLK